MYMRSHDSAYPWGIGLIMERDTGGFWGTVTLCLDVNDGYKVCSL